MNHHKIQRKELIQKLRRIYNIKQVAKKGKKDDTTVNEVVAPI